MLAIQVLKLLCYTLCLFQFVLLVFSEIDTILDCIETKLETSTQTYDVLIQQMYSFDNVRAIIKYTCKIAPGKQLNH